MAKTVKEILLAEARKLQSKAKTKRNEADRLEANAKELEKKAEETK